MSARRICVVSGSRADYGLLRGLMRLIKEDPGLDLQIVATGMHLVREFGMTLDAFAEDGFEVGKQVDMLLAGDSDAAISKSIGLGIIGFADAFRELRPDVVVLLGDRFEMYSAACAALVARLPMAHLHGGETTEGAMDEAFRHAMTKMAHLHFVATEAYRRRVIQLGEAPERVFNVGGLGLDAVRTLPRMARGELEASLGFRFHFRNLLVTFHPATLDETGASEQFREVLAALEELPDTGLLFTYPNADAGGRTLIPMIDDFVARRPDCRRAFASLGSLRYLSCLAQVDGVIGNSSSGLIEAPSFHIGTVNIGSRQQGRERAASVIDCPAQRQAILAAIGKLYSREFQAGLATVVNPYGDGGASERILAILRDHPLQGILLKSFHDLPAGG